MFLVPLLILAGLGYAVYAVVHHRHVMVSSHGAMAAVEHGSPWPTTTFGWVGLGALALALVNMALVNVFQVAYVAWALVLAAVLFTGLARFVKHDHSAAVLIAFIVTALGATAGVLFLLGEVFIGHD